MENKNVNVNSSKGISVCGLLTSVLVVLKALGYISCACGYASYLSSSQ